MSKRKKLCALFLAVCLTAALFPMPIAAMSTAEAEALPLPESNCGVPNYFQNDYPDIPYGDGTMATSGCGPTFPPMVATYLTGYTYTPDMIAEYFSGLENNVLRMDLGSDGLNLRWHRAENLNEAVEALKEGDVVIGFMGPQSRFTSTQHFIVLAGITEDGKILVNDPMKPHYSNPQLARALREGFTWGEMVGGFGGGWVYDVSAMEEPQYQHTPFVKPRYPHVTLSQQDKDLIAKVVMLEAGEKSSACQQAVAEVILNRLVRWGYSDYVPGVLYSENRFSGPLYHSPLPDITPTQAHYDAVEKAYTGPYIFPSDYVTYFGTTAWNESVWGEIDGMIFCNFS